MKKIMMIIALTIFFSSFATAQSLNISLIQQLTGYQGNYDKKNNLFKISVPRDDLNITVTSVKLIPQMGLISWVIFKNVDTHTIIRGDIVLSEEQVAPVLNVVLQNGLKVTGLENRYLWEAARPVFLRIEGSGDERKLAFAVGKVFQAVKTTSKGHGDFPFSNIDISESSISPAQLNHILGSNGNLKNGIYRVVLSSGIQSAGESVGTNSWAVFAGKDNEAIVDGNFALLDFELATIIKPLKKAGIYIVSINQHLTERDQPFLLVHFWGIGRSETMARGIRMALNEKLKFEAKTVVNKTGKLMFSTIVKCARSCPIYAVNPRIDEMIYKNTHDKLEERIVIQHHPNKYTASALLINLVRTFIDKFL